MIALRGLLLVAALGVLLTLRSSHPERPDSASVSTSEPMEPVEPVETLGESSDELIVLTAEEMQEMITLANERAEEAKRSSDNPGCMWPPHAFGEPRFRDPYGPSVPPRAPGK